MRVAIRADASLRIGTGHVFRCLTLADALRSRGAEVAFVSRAQQGNLHGQIEARGYPLFALPVADKSEIDEEAAAEPEHADWLEATWEDDAEQTCRVLGDCRWDWLVLDHYALDHRWERLVRERSRRIMVIDDLADRAHHCDLLLDQNLGREVYDYDGLVPDQCIRLIGPQYALLRPEFAELRDYSLRRRQQSKLRQVLVTMGGVDQANATGAVLEALKACPLPADCRITVVLGRHAPWREEVERLAVEMPWPTEVAVAVSDMGRRMAESDLVIGAAGGTAWERCALGVPTLLVVLAPNQVQGAQALCKAQAVRLLGSADDFVPSLEPAITALKQPDALASMAAAAAKVCDGRGVERVLTAMEAVHG